MKLHLWTHLLLLLVSNLVLLVPMSLGVEVAWFLYLCLLFLWESPRAWRSLIAFTGFYLGVVAVTEWFVGTGRLALVAVSLLFILRKTLPVAFVGQEIWRQTQVDEWMQGLAGLGLPMTLIIPLTVTFRLLPNVLEEYRYVRQAQKMRMSQAPLMVRLEGLLMAFLMSGLAIGDELANAAEVRGLGYCEERTFVTENKLHLPDFLVMGSAFIYFVLVLGKVGLHA